MVPYLRLNIFKAPLAFDGINVYTHFHMKHVQYNGLLCGKKIGICMLTCIYVCTWVECLLTETWCLSDPFSGTVSKNKVENIPLVVGE